MSSLADTTSRKRVRDVQLGQEAKTELYAALGGCCVHCGFADARALQIDHINGGGRPELVKTGNRRHYYRRLLRDIDNTLSLYQLLCANCNWIKRVVNVERGHWALLPKSTQSIIAPVAQ